MKPDLDSPEHIALFVDRFYQKMLCDDLLAPIFTDVALIDIHQHIPIICSYWEKLLLGKKNYKRHTMNKHRAIHARYVFTDKEFERWLMFFKQTAEQGFEGVYTQRAVAIATTIAANMQKSLSHCPVNE